MDSETQRAYSQPIAVAKLNSDSHSQSQSQSQSLSLSIDVDYWDSFGWGFDWHLDYFGFGSFELEAAAPKLTDLLLSTLSTLSEFVSAVVVVVVHWLAVA
jgi:hypothetical protein